MGLPVWRNPDEARIKREDVKTDPTAEARSPIRRRERPPFARRRTPPRNESTRNFPPRLDRSPPPSVGFNGGLREGRQSENRTVPPIATLLESADRRITPRSRIDRVRHTRTRISELNARENELQASISELRNQATRLRHESRSLVRELELPEGWRNWTHMQRAEWLAGQRSREEEVTEFVRGLVAEQSATNDLPDTARPQSTSRAATEDSESLFMPDTSMQPTGARRTHPLSNSWRPESPIDGLGDRNRSPTPADGWEVMRSTITPDVNLPSADSSFTSAAASHSFTSNSTEADVSSSSADSQDSSRQAERSTSVSSADFDDICNEADRHVEAEVAATLYAREMRSPEGRERVRERYAEFEHENRRRTYADPDEPESVEIGFRLIHEALRSTAGRARLDAVSDELGQDRNFLSEVRVRMMYRRYSGRDTTRTANITAERPPSPHPERYGENARAAVRQASAQVHDYFRRFTADSLAHSERSDVRRDSPPPRYEPLASHPDVNAFVSRDEPVAHPVSPPVPRDEQEMADVLLQGNDSDTEPMRRIVERLAQMDDVPDDWWVGMGLQDELDSVRSTSGSSGAAGMHSGLDQIRAANGLPPAAEAMAAMYEAEERNRERLRLALSGRLGAGSRL